MPIKIFIITFIFIGYIFLFLTKNEPFLYLSNFVVPDGQTYLFYINEINNGFPIMEIGPEQFLGLPNSFLLWAVYLIPYQFMGLFGVLLFHMLLIILAFRIINPACIILVPYLLISTILPSKDFLIFIITSLLIYNLFYKKWVYSMLVALISFLVRDGAGVVNAAIVFGCLFLNYYSINKKFIFINLLLFGIILSTIIESIAGDYFIFIRNKDVSDIYSNVNLPPYGSILGYISRIFANVTNLGFRQPIFDIDYNLSILGFFYFISGIFSILTFIYFFKQILSNKYDSYRNNLLFKVYFIALFSTSMNPLVSARYLLPVVAAIMGNLFLGSKSEISNYLKPIPIIFVFCLIAILFQVTLGVYPSLNDVGSNIDAEFFIWKY